MVDLACMRDAMKKLGADPNKINPLVCESPFFPYKFYCIVGYQLVLPTRF